VKTAILQARPRDVGSFQLGITLASAADGMKVRDVIRRLREDGWVLVAQEGSHRQFKHPTKVGRVTVAGHEGAEVKPKTLNSVLKQAGLR
jgi:predicted RNA binding protein YcfA (HicA-like mRNA interferase family)